MNASGTVLWTRTQALVPGINRIPANASSLPGGLYFAVVKMPGKQSAIPVLILK